MEPYTSPGSSPVVLVKMKDDSLHFCEDCERLNKVTTKDMYPIPRVDDILDSLQGSPHVSALVLRNGY